MSVNRVILLGRLGKDPESKAISNGNTLATFSLATDKKVNGEEKTEWHKVVCFGKTAEFVSRYLGKGRMVYVEGELQTRTYEKNGEKRYMTEVVAGRIEAIGPRPGGNDVDTPAATNQAPAATPADDDDLPF